MARNEAGGGSGMNKVKELKIWYVDDSMRTIIGEDAENAVIQLFEYSKTGYPLFIEVGKGDCIASAQIDSFRFIEEEAE
jgi:hypothetical protein